MRDTDAVGRPDQTFAPAFTPGAGGPIPGVAADGLFLVPALPTTFIL